LLILPLLSLPLFLPLQLVTGARASQDQVVAWLEEREAAKQEPPTSNSSAQLSSSVPFHPSAALRVDELTLALLQASHRRLHRATDLSEDALLPYSNPRRSPRQPACVRHARRNDLEAVRVAAAKP